MFGVLDGADMVIGRNLSTRFRSTAPFCVVNLISDKSGDETSSGMSCMCK